MDNKKAIMDLINKYNEKQDNGKLNTYTNNIEKMKKELENKKIRCFNKFIENIKKLPLDEIYPFQSLYKINLSQCFDSKTERDGFLFSSSLFPDDIKMLFSIKKYPDINSDTSFDYTFSLYPVMGEENDLFVLTKDNQTPIALPWIIASNVLNHNLNILKEFGISNKIYDYKTLENDLCKAIQNTIKEKYNILLDDEKKIIEEYSKLTKEIDELNKMDEMLNNQKEN